MTNNGLRAAAVTLTSTSPCLRFSAVGWGQSVLSCRDAEGTPRVVEIQAFMIIEMDQSEMVGRNRLSPVVGG